MRPPKQPPLKGPQLPPRGEPVWRKTAQPNPATSTPLQGVEAARRDEQSQALLTGRQGLSQAMGQILMKFGLVAFIGLSLVLAASVFLRQQDEYRRVQRRAKDLKEQWEEVIRASNQIEQRFSQILSPAEVEALARNELGMVRPGEVVYKDRKDEGR